MHLFDVVDHHSVFCTVLFVYKEAARLFEGLVYCKENETQKLRVRVMNLTSFAKMLATAAAVWGSAAKPENPYSGKPSVVSSGTTSRLRPLWIFEAGELYEKPRGGTPAYSELGTTLWRSPRIWSWSSTMSVRLLCIDRRKPGSTDVEGANIVR